jgi:uncharacterized protein YjbI with pentapeptide repeats
MTMKIITKIIAKTTTKTITKASTSWQTFDANINSDFDDVDFDDVDFDDVDFNDVDFENFVLIKASENHFWKTNDEISFCEFF